VGGAGESANKLACIKVILSYRGSYLTLQDIIVFCAVIFSIWLYYKKKSISGAGSIFSQKAWDWYRTTTGESLNGESVALLSMLPLNSSRSQLKLKGGAIAQTGFSQKSRFFDLALMARPGGSRVPITPAIDTSLDYRLSAIKIRL
jgi:hypothetical protein